MSNSLPNHGGLNQERCGLAGCSGPMQLCGSLPIAMPGCNTSGPLALTPNVAKGGAGAGSGTQCACDNTGCSFGYSDSLPGADGSIGCGSTGCCLAADTPVPLAGGGCKPAAEIRVGDRLVGAEGTPEEVVRIFGAFEESMMIVSAAGTLVCSQSHLLMESPNQVVAARDLEIGQEVLSAESEKVRVDGLFSKGLVQVFGWTCQPTHIYRAGNYLNHNKEAEQLTMSLASM